MSFDDAGASYDITPADPPAYTSSAQQTPLARAPAPAANGGTEFVVFKDARLLTPTGWVATGSAGSAQKLTGHFEAPAVSGPDEVVTRTATARNVLLDRMFDGQDDRELLLRVEILTQRLRRLSPRVHDDEIDALTEMIRDVEEADAALAASRASGWAL